jgi:hypothetical protein
MVAFYGPFKSFSGCAVDASDGMRDFHYPGQMPFPNGEQTRNTFAIITREVWPPVIAGALVVGCAGVSLLVAAVT